MDAALKGLTRQQVLVRVRETSSVVPLFRSVLGCCGTVQYGTVRYGTVRYGTVRYGWARPSSVHVYTSAGFVGWLPFITMPSNVFSVFSAHLKGRVIRYLVHTCKRRSRQFYKRTNP